MARKFKTEVDLQGNKIVNLAPGVNPTDAVNKSQLDEVAQGGQHYKGAYDAATNSPNLTANDGSVLTGYQYTVNVGGTFAGQTVEQGDLIISEIDNPTTNADFTIVNKNTTPVGASTTTVAGIIEIATQVEVNAGTDTTRAVTPATMANYVANNAPVTPDASETVKGKAEIATQVETDAGTDDVRIITPLKLATYVAANSTKKFVQTGVTLGDAAGNVTITHGLGNKHFSLTAQDSSTGEEYEIEVSSKTFTTAVIAGSGSAFVVDVIIIG